MSSSAFVPVPWRSGTISDRALAGRVVEQLVELAWDRAGGSRPGTSSTRSIPSSSAASIAAGGGGVVAPLVVLDDRRAVAAGDPLGDAIAADDDDPLERGNPAERHQHVGEHRVDERAPVGGAEPVAQALLGLREALDREDREGPHGAGTLLVAEREAPKRFRPSEASAKRALLGHPPARVGGSISTSVSSTGTRSVRSSATRPSIIPS